MEREDDFEAVYGLLHNAGGRYRSARATVVHTVNAAVAREANRRFVDWRFAQGSPGMGIVGKPGPPEPEDFYHEYEDSEERIRVWHERPDRWREEIYGAEGRLEEAEVGAATSGPRWTYTRYHPDLQGYLAVYAPELPMNHGLETQFSFMLDPSEYVFAETFWDGTTVFEAGHETVLAGRGCVEVRAETVSWGYPPYVFGGAYNASSEGATDHLMLVDKEIGTILRVAARLDGEEFRVAEVGEISYNEDFPEDTFKLELPGVEFERWELPDHEKRGR
jgi:hypothetical protein